MQIESFKNLETTYVMFYNLREKTKPKQKKTWKWNLIIHKHAIAIFHWFFISFSGIIYHLYTTNIIFNSFERIFVCCFS